MQICRGSLVPSVASKSLALLPLAKKALSVLEVKDWRSASAAEIAEKREQVASRCNGNTSGDDAQDRRACWHQLGKSSAKKA
ncbi:MAG: hypothetical protein R3E00_12855 [Paracoccaceae bacterium]